VRAASAAVGRRSTCCRPPAAAAAAVVSAVVLTESATAEEAAATTTTAAVATATLSIFPDPHLLIHPPLLVLNLGRRAREEEYQERPFENNAVELED